MPTKSEIGNTVARVLVDAKKSPKERATILMGHCMSAMGEPVQMMKLFTTMFGKMDELTKDATPIAQELKKQYEQALLELTEGPVRLATFVNFCDRTSLPGSNRRALVLSPDGQPGYPVVSEQVDLKELTPGKIVLLDPKGAIVMGFSSTVPSTGHEAAFLRLFDTNEIEVQYNHEKLALYASQQVLDAAHDGTLTRNDSVLFCPTQRMAFRVVPQDNDKSDRFVDSSKIPNIDIARDVGNPHWSLGWLIRRASILINRQDLLDELDMRPRVSILMIGGPGTGKTFTIKAYLKAFQDMIRERTGSDKVSSRTVRVKMGDLLSEWLGRSDKNVEQLFDDILALGSEPVELDDGTRVRLPVNVIIEEADGFGAQRTGGGEDGAGGAFNRICSTILQRFDDPIDAIGHLPLVFISTSNKPGHIDAGVFRRISGGMVARFSRLDSEGISAVLAKKIKPEYRLANQNGDTHSTAKSRLVNQVVSWLDAPNGSDSGLLDVVLRDGTKITKYRKDFCTPAIIEQAMSTAIDELAFDAEASGETVQGLSADLLIDSFCRQVDPLASVITRFNVDDYLDLPEHAQVAEVRPLRAPRPTLVDLVEE